MKGCLSAFTTSRPTVEQYNDTTIPHLEMTLDSWDPVSKTFAEKEELAKSVMIASVTQRPGYQMDCFDRTVSAVMMAHESQNRFKMYDDPDRFDERHSLCWIVSAGY